jgi:pimeloyl-ACP methyl ester carboxylesterase
VPADYVQQLNQAVAEGRRGDAVEIFMSQAILIPAEFVAQMRYGPTTDVFDGEAKPPEWASMEAVAHTLAYDGTIMGDTMSGKPLPRNKWAAAAMPTLVIVGGESEPFFHNGTRALVEILPNARHAVLEGQSHAVSHQALAPMLIEFFN